MLEKIQLSNRLTQDKDFQQGVKQFQEGIVPEQKGVRAMWVKKFISITDYNSYYKYNNSYCFLKKEPRKGVWLGFLVAGVVPKDCEEMTDEEARQMDLYRRAENIYPYL